VRFGGKRLEFIPGGLVDLRADLDAVHGQSLVDETRNVKPDWFRDCSVGRSAKFSSVLLRVTVLRGYALSCNFFVGACAIH
jgi:hypothetical protein